MKERILRVVRGVIVCCILNILILSFGGIAVSAQAKPEEKAKVEKTDSTQNKKETEYDKLLKDAKTQEGLFKVHESKGKYYFEIPVEIMDKDFLISSRVSKVSTPLNASAGRMPREPIMISFDYDTIKKKLYLVQKNVDFLIDKDSETYSSFKNNHIDAIWKAYKIEAFNEDSTAVVVNLENLFVSGEKIFDPFVAKASGIKFSGSIDSNRSRMLGVKSFSDNIRVSSLLTFNVSNMPYTVEMTRNIVLLPEDKMKLRYSDERVGFFERDRYLFSPYEHIKQKKIITRWRLEPKKEDIEKYKKGFLVEPKKQIVWYVDPAIPDDYKKYIKLGIEDWQLAFEEIGFKNAIVAKDYPTKEENPDFDPDDIKYNCYRYSTTFEKNSMGPSWIDPRTGEIICGDVYFYSNVISILQEWRFIQTAQIDEEVRTPEYNNRLMGESLRYVAAHEIGHTLGLMHNFVSSYAYPVDSLRSASFTKEYGTTPSIMDYARYNYVAQPEDKGKGLYLLPPKLGVYDKFAIKYGYKPIFDVAEASEEEDILNEWLLEHKDDPMYTYLNPYTHGSLNPASQEEAIGDDAIKAGEYGIKNLKYIVKHMPDWLLIENKDYKTLDAYYKAVDNQFKTYMLHVARYLGGEYMRPTVYGDGVTSHRFVSKAKQREALDFIFKQLEDYPKWYADKNVTQYLKPQSYRNTYNRYKIFSFLFGEMVAHGILHAELGQVDGCYKYSEFHDDIFKYVWGKTQKGKEIDDHTMLLQNAYVNELLKGLKETKVEEKAVYLRREPISICSHEGCHSTSLMERRNIALSQTAVNPRQAPVMGSMALRTHKLLKKMKNRGDEKTKSHYQTLYFKLKLILKE